MLLYFFSITFLLPAAVFSSYSAEEKDELKLIAEKEAVLNAVYESYIKKTLSNEFQYDLIPSDKIIALQHIDNEKEFFAALHERYTAITLNVICWTCSIYYAEGVVDGDAKSAEKAKKCAEMATALAWYNSRFTVERITGAFCRRITFEDARCQLNIYDFLRNTNTVWLKLDIVNRVFGEANLNYKNVFQKLRTMGANLAEYEAEDIQQKDQEFMKILWLRFAAIIDSQTWAEMDSYVWKFLEGKELTNWISRMRPNFEEFLTMFKIIQETPKIEAKYSDLMKILDLERRFLQSRLIANDIAIPDSATSRKWVVKENRGEYEVDKYFKFKETIAN